MADVILNINSGQINYEGSAVIYTDRLGNHHDKNPEINQPIPISATENKLTNRFDDPLFYSA